MSNKFSRGAKNILGRAKPP